MTFRQTFAAIQLVQALGIIGFALLGVAVLLSIVSTVRNRVRVSRTAVAKDQRPVRLAPDGRRIADSGYTEMAEKWFHTGLSSPRFAALNHLDFMLGGIFEVAYEDPALDEWMQDVYAHIRHRELMAVATKQWLTDEEQVRISDRRQEMLSPDYEP